MLPFVVDMPPLEQERIVCSISAAVKYDVPANIVLAIARKEGGKPGQRVYNTSNGTYDVGAMQFNTAYLSDLEKYGVTANDVAAPGCYPFDLAAWRIRGHILNDKGDLWTKAANYHSRTPKYNTIYRDDLIKKAIEWTKWLSANFTTVKKTEQGGATPTGPVVRYIVNEANKIESKSLNAQENITKNINIEYHTPRSISFKNND
ncbi:muramidase [Marinobacter sp.]|uniref:muramidase n=1 Tax=Marinobacter sp. TaxID=50741 RepID=UPI003A8F6C31